MVSPCGDNLTERSSYPAGPTLGHSGLDRALGGGPARFDPAASRRYPAAVSTRTRVALVGLVVWTVFVWGNRISNAWRSTTETTGAKVGSTLLAASFLVFAAAGAVIAARSWRRGFGRGEVVVLRAFAAWTTVVWVWRIVAISLADHAVGFKAVHAVLGLVSIALAALVWRATSTPATVSPPEPARVR